MDLRCYPWRDPQGPSQAAHERAARQPPARWVERRDGSAVARSLALRVRCRLPTGDRRVSSPLLKRDCGRQVTQDFNALRDAATAGEHQPCVAEAHGCEFAFEVAWAVEIAVLSTHRLQAWDRGWEDPGMCCVEQNRRVQRPVVQVILSVNTREEPATDELSWERPNRSGDMTPLLLQPSEPSRVQRAGTSSSAVDRHRRFAHDAIGDRVSTRV